MSEKVNASSENGTQKNTPEGTDVIDFQLAKDRVRLDQLLFFINIGATIYDPEDPTSLGMMDDIAMQNLEELMKMILPDSPLENYLRTKTKEISAIKDLIAKAIALSCKIKDDLKQFLDRIGASPKSEDIDEAREKVRFKTQWEMGQEKARAIAVKILETLYPSTNIPDAEDDNSRLTYINLHAIVDGVLQTKEKDREDLSNLDRSIPREWVVNSAECILKRNPNCEDDLWKVLRFLWETYRISDFKEIENSINERLGRITERKARCKANEMLLSWLYDISLGMNSESEVVEWMLKRYQQNFTGENKEYGERFGHVYLEELKKCITNVNNFLMESRERIQAVNGIDTHNSPDEFEQASISEAMAIDTFFIRRLINYFKQHGIEVKLKSD